MHRHLFIFSQRRTMAAVGLFFKSDSSETSAENDDCLFSWHNKHFEILSQYSARKKMQCKLLFFQWSFSFVFTQFKRRNATPHPLAARLVRRSCQDFTPADQRRLYRTAPCCVTAECNTIRHYKLLFTPQTQEQETQVNSRHHPPTISSQRERPH